MNNVSPLRYPGGKTRACKILYEIIKENGINLEEYDYLVSPFFGGGSFEFFISNKYPNLIVLANDKFAPLYNFWDTITYPHKQNNLCEILTNDLGQITKEKFFEKRKNLTKDNFEESIEKAADYFTINRCSFSGSTLSGGFSAESSTKRFTKSSIDKISKLNLSQFNFFNLNFDIFLATSILIPADKTYFIFLDPPYYLEKGSKLYGTSGDLHETFDHESLSNLIKVYNSLNVHWMLTYNDCKYIRDLYNWGDTIKIREVDWKYGMNKSKNSSEIVITNF